MRRHKLIDSDVDNIQWNGVIGKVFDIHCGVRQGGILFPMLCCIYMDDLIKELRLSGFGRYLSNLFIGSILYADDILFDITLMFRPSENVRYLLMFFSKLHRTDNIVLQTLMRVPMVKYEILSLAVKYGLNDEREGVSTIKDAAWSCFVQKVQL